MIDDETDSRRKDVEALGEAFWAANANPEYLGQEIADLARKLIRASISRQPSSGINEATRLFVQVANLAARLSGPDLRESFAVAVKSLQLPSEVTERRDGWALAAENGTRYFIELTSGDGFSSARASKAQENFMWSVGRLKDAAS